MNKKQLKMEKSGKKAASQRQMMSFTLGLLEE